MADREPTGEALTGAEDVHGYVGRVCFKTGPPRRVGVELEWLVADADRPERPVPVEALAERLAGAMPGGSAVTFEPGGQVELSSPPGAGLAACLAAATADLARLTESLQDLGLTLVPSAIDPYRSPRRQLRTERYEAMERYFDARGTLGRIMMCCTAAVQVNLDAGADTADVVRRWRLLHEIGPALVAAFANSPVLAGQVTGWKSTRQVVWQRLDPPRTGTPAGADPVSAWARYALAAPVLAVRGARWRADPGMTFAQWLARDDPPTADDLAFHLTTLFPPVRPRGFVEVRYLDALPPRWWPVPVAVLTALTDDPDAGETARAAARRARDSGGDWLTAARYGPSHPGLAAAARTCFAAARDVLPHHESELLDGYLDRYLTRGRCPADDALEAR